MRTRLLLATALLACAAPRPRPPSGAPALTFTGRVQNGPFEFAPSDLAGLPRDAFDAVPPFDGRRARFEGIAVAALLGEVMELEDDADTAVFEGDAGIAAPVPVVVLRMLKPVLADGVNGAPVASWRASAAPLQLAWPNVANPGIDTDPRLRWWWVPGVRRVDFRSWAGTYGRALRVPPGGSDDARRGAADLAASCIGCHRVGGQGGTRGPPLTATSAADPAALARLLHGHLRATSGMPGAPEVREATARGIASFLTAAELAGPPPDEPPPPELPPASLPPPAGGPGPRTRGGRRRRGPRRQIAQM